LAGALLAEWLGADSAKVPNERKEAAMNATAEKERPKMGSGIYHPSARPMEVVKDEEGQWWLCDKGVDPRRDLEEQGCWRCGERAFTRND